MDLTGTWPFLNPPCARQGEKPSLPGCDRARTVIFHSFTTRTGEQALVALAQLAPKAQFAKIHIEISNICNLQCSFCPAVERKKGTMSVEDFEMILSQVGPMAEQVCLHLMGEPLLHPQIGKLIDICEEKGVRLFLVSNAVLLKERSMQMLLRPAFRQLNFSLHSFKDNFGDIDPTPYLNKVFTLTERAFAERPDLYINYRLWNLDDPRGSSFGNMRMLKAIEERFGVSIEGSIDVRKKKSFKISNRLYLHFDTEFVWPSMDLPEQGTRGRCYGLSSHFGILVDGTVVPCCLDKEGVITLGNIKEQPIEEILNSPRAQAMLKGFKNGKLVESLCQRCQYIDRFR
ncbi:MAG: radical SAM/SPASM domain-containing protein [Proteobacteria bacterium]|nr:MAG: radical SAM/SPASM domain-containing protein [Pseudomonadota bacterium]